MTQSNVRPLSVISLGAMVGIVGTAALSVFFNLTKPFPPKPKLSAFRPPDPVQ